MSRYNIKKAELEKLCEDPVLKNKIKNAKDGKEARQFIKEVLADNQDVTEVTAESCMKKLKLSDYTNANSDGEKEENDDANKEGPEKENEDEKTEELDKNNQNKEELENTNNEELDKKKDKEKKKEANKEIEEKQRIEAVNKKKTDEENEAKKRIEKLIKNEKITGKTEEEKKAVYLCLTLLAEADTLKAENKKLVEENDSLKDKNELLKQQVKVLNDQRGIKDNFASKIPSLNDIASSEDKTSVFINKEVLVKATKYVDAHCLISLENVILNGHDLNSAIVQSVLLEFILQNSLL